MASTLQKKRFEKEALCLTQSASIRQCMELIDRNKQGIALIVDQTGRLLGTISDGDIRRFILRDGALDTSVSKIMWQNPLTASKETPRTEILGLMNEHMVTCVPIMDQAGHPCDLVTMQELVTGSEMEQTAVIMAGGEGRRLRPLTEQTPKPLLEVDNEPILKKIIDEFATAGIRNIFIAVNYKSDIIEEFCGTIDNGVKIRFLKEPKKLGTAGALSLLPELPMGPLVIINGDIITKANFKSFLEFHKQHRCVMTVAAAHYRLRIPYGVLNLSDHYLLGIDEKPEQTFLCNAGLYAINPEILSLIPRDVEFNMTDLVAKVISKGLPVCTFPIHEYWVDIGEKRDLRRARLHSKIESNGRLLEK